MNEWTEIRRKVMVDGVSVRQICREYNVSHHTVKKMIALAEPPAFVRTGPRPRPKLDRFVGVIDQILIDDRTAPPKQHHTAKRIFERLRDEHGYAGSESQVRAFVAQRRMRTREVFVPLAQPAGEAQFDFGEAQVDIAGTRVKAHLAVMSLPHSDAFFVSAYPSECTETFQQAHVAAFEYFGGVPTKIAYDNTTIAVKKVMLGPNRELTDGFLRLQSHYLFTHRFCRVARGNEKGHVENNVGYHRRNFLVPVPSFESFAALNEYLAARCFADLDRVVRGESDTDAARLEDDLVAMRMLTGDPFEARRIEHVKSNSLSLVRFHRNEYSVPTAYAHRDLVVVATVESLNISADGAVVATHPRCWGREETFFDPMHYLALLERKPGDFDFAKPLAKWTLPECFHLLRRRLEAERASGATKEFIKVLRLLETFSLTELTKAVTTATDMGTTSYEAVSLIVNHAKEEPTPLFSLDGRPHLAGVAVDCPDLRHYAELVGVGA